MSHVTPSLQQAKRQLLAQGPCTPPGSLDERLAQSWQRSARAGLQPMSALDLPEPVSGAELENILHDNSELLAHARPVMDFIYHQIRGSHSMVVLADAHSLLLHTQGDRAFLNKAQRVALKPGACWKEDSRGTNAIGTALIEATPIRVRGHEHFLEQNAFLHCAAAPIFSAQGQVAGVIDISGEPMVSQSHTLGMASMAARMIENSWLKSAYPQYPCIHLHSQPEGLDTPAEGLIVMRPDGMLVGANQAAMRMLQLDAADFFSLRLDERLQQRLAQLLQSRNAQVQPLRLPNRQRLHLRVQIDHPPAIGLGIGGHGPAIRNGATAPLPAANLSPAATTAPSDALALLDTGDPQWHAASQKVRRILAKPIPLLIQGESGVGKEVFARAAHDSGPRSGKPFVAINCAAIPESLIEAELFGYAPGAYTGAQKTGSLGRIREADGGTLFLDEIGDMPLTLQTRLLRVLQERQVTPLGGTPVAVDFALISATHCPLEQAIADGLFRADLYYRINGFSVRLPALRERQDLDTLAARMLQQFGAPPGTVIATELATAMRHHPWPGNLRQLASMLQTACALLGEHETRIDWSHLADDIATTLAQPAPPPTPTPTPVPPPAATAAVANTSAACTNAAPNQNALHTTDIALPGPLRQLSHNAIQATLQACAGNVSLAARQLGISRQTIYRHLRSAAAQAFTPPRRPL